jgi:chemotaxis response regulator CheB
MATETKTPNVVAVGASAGGVEALSERYEAMANESEHAMAVLGHRLSEAYAKNKDSGG